MSKGIILHIDVNSAYPSWEAVHRLQLGYSPDLRSIPSAVGGNPETRHGIIPAKSIPAKRFNIQTGETVFSALKKCPGLFLVPPNYQLYRQCSLALKSIPENYSPLLQPVTECSFFGVKEKLTAC